MSEAQVVYVFILALLAGLLAIIVSDRRSEAVALVIFMEFSCFARWAANWVNFQTEIFSQKDASEFSLNMLDGPGGIWGLFSGGIVDGIMKGKFFLEAFVNIPAIRLFEESIYTLNTTNGFVGAISGLVVYVYFRKLFDIRVATLGLIFTSFFPAAFAFSFFSLRDIFMYFLILLNVCSFTWFYLRIDYRSLNITLYLISAFLLIMCRLELILFIVALPGWTILMALLRMISRVKSRPRKMFAAACLVIFIPVSITGVAYEAYTIAIKKLGKTDFVDPLEIVSDVAAARNTRGADNGVSDLEGGGRASDEIPAAIYKRTPVPVRLMIQVVGMIIVPMPWLLTSPSRLLGAIDSAFVITLMVWGFRARTMFKPKNMRKLWIPDSISRYNQRRLKNVLVGLLWSFALATVGFGMVVDNGGNAFRMRLCILPYVIMNASIFASCAFAWSGTRLMRARTWLAKQRSASVTGRAAGSIST
jgi:hypothetical protein